MSWTVDRVSSGPAVRIYTANIQHLVDVEHDQELRNAFADVDQCLCDGQALFWLARLAGTPLRERVTGVDLAHHLLVDPRMRGLRVTFVGAKPVEVDDLLNDLRSRYQMVHWLPPHHGYFEGDAWVPVIANVARQAPDIVFAALGSPKQELWTRAAATGVTRGALITVGGALHVLAGRVPRAPRWVQRTGLEWAFRTFMEPRRLAPRYVRNACRALPIAIHILRTRGGA